MAAAEKQSGTPQRACRDASEAAGWLVGPREGRGGAATTGPGDAWARSARAQSKTEEEGRRRSLEERKGAGGG